MSEKEIKFIVDFMLGRLCKWLRIVGYDASYFIQKDHKKKNQIIYESLKEGRIILTRNRRISSKKAIKVIYVTSDYVEEQVRQVLEELEIKINPDLVFRRCLVCNLELKKIEKEKVGERVPPYVYETQENFSFCLQCQRIYWPGTHVKQINEKLKGFFKE